MRISFKKFFYDLRAFRVDENANTQLKAMKATKLVGYIQIAASLDTALDKLNQIESSDGEIALFYDSLSFVLVEFGDELKEKNRLNKKLATNQSKPKATTSTSSSLKSINYSTKICQTLLKKPQKQLFRFSIFLILFIFNLCKIK